MRKLVAHAAGDARRCVSVVVEDEPEGTIEDRRGGEDPRLHPAQVEEGSDIDATCLELRAGKDGDAEVRGVRERIEGLGERQSRSSLTSSARRSASLLNPLRTSSLLLGCERLVGHADDVLESRRALYPIGGESIPAIASTSCRAANSQPRAREVAVPEGPKRGRIRELVRRIRGLQRSVTRRRRYLTGEEVGDQPLYSLTRKGG